MVYDTSELRTYPSKALAPRWSGPWTILAAVNNVVASVGSDFKHKLGLPETVKLLGIDRLLAVPKGLRWEEVNILSTYSREACDSVLEQGWSARDLFGEILEGADPSPRLHLLGVNPAEVDQSYDEVDGEGRDDCEEDGDEDYGVRVNYLVGGWVKTLPCFQLTLGPAISRAPTPVGTLE